MKIILYNINITVAFNEQDYKSYIDGVEDYALDPRTIQIVARNLTDWKQLACYLLLTEAEIEEIKHDYPKYIDQKYRCIVVWTRKNSKAGTILNLLWHVYFELNDKSVVMKIVEDLKNKGIHEIHCMVDVYTIVICTVLDADKENFCAVSQPLPRRQV